MAPILNRHFKFLTPADNRQGHLWFMSLMGEKNPWEDRRRLDLPLRRVRSLAVGKRYGSLKEIILKRIHGKKKAKRGSAEKEVKAVLRAVARHNEQNWPNRILREPKFHVISPTLVAMARVNAPTAGQVLGISGRPSIGWRTPEAEEARKKLLAQDESALKKLEGEVAEMEKITGISRDNFLFLGKKGGKFDFVPLCDTL